MSGAAEKRWRTIVRRTDGVAVLRSPDGREFLGTAAEVRSAAMTPERRRMLADGLRVARITTEPRTDTRAWLAAERRRWAIQETAFDKTQGVTLPASLAILAEAAARYAGMSLDEWVAEWVAAGFDAETDDAIDNGLGGLPLTRHERAALKRLGGLPDTGKGVWHG